MRFLIDAALSTLVADGLRQHGHDAVHVRDLALQTADDEVIFALAKQEGRVLVSADTDFGTCLRSAVSPSRLFFSYGEGLTAGPTASLRWCWQILRLSRNLFDEEAWL